MSNTAQKRVLTSSKKPNRRERIRDDGRSVDLLIDTFQIHSRRTDRNPQTEHRWLPNLSDRLHRPKPDPHAPRADTAYLNQATPIQRTIPLNQKKRHKSVQATIPPTHRSAAPTQPPRPDGNVRGIKQRNPAKEAGGSTDRAEPDEIGRVID
jgi:hypothetical protein